MKEKKYFQELAKIPMTRLNEITRAINGKTPKEDAGLKTEVEKMFFDRGWKEAEDHEKKYGTWPTFEMGEIEYDDPVLDIYKDPPEKWNQERKARRGTDEITEV